MPAVKLENHESHLCIDHFIICDEGLCSECTQRSCLFLQVNPMADDFFEE
ncbi:hypothetical protein DEALK_02160 [Dehalogenimonas alkenigignens]|uniref:Uncharacterized protein n=1 Tax=Dehalogenimonas alkenigignens TaxID=1217799 RepID=A0A0W0GL88_9CHLR|nr:hypothetical protein DEALK_02160 [Dehalogenimonas alkenigignens]